MGSESRLLRMHAGNGEHSDMNERAQICVAQAHDDAEIPANPQLHATLKAYFWWATERMSGYPESEDDVPNGLTMAYWSWDGPA